MLYTPKYCCECGGEIENYTRKILTSRRFCENCENDFKGQKFFPLIWIGLGLLGIIYGFGSYLKKSDKPVNLLTTSSLGNASNKTGNPENKSNSQVRENVNVQLSTRENAANNAGNQINAAKVSGDAERKSRETGQNANQGKQNSVSEAVYICGAETKKGTACLRRVRGGGRCWQHKDQPAILPPSELVLKR